MNTMRTRRDTITSSKLTLGCFGFLMMMIVAYLYFLNMSVVQVVMRTDYVKQQHELSAEIAQLEATFIGSQHAVAARIATLEGYNTDIPKVFVSRSQSSLVLNSN